MKIITVSTLILAVSILGRVSCSRVLQDVARVGIDLTSPPTPTTSDAEANLIAALGLDAHITGQYEPSAVMIQRRIGILEFQLFETRTDVRSTWLTASMMRHLLSRVTASGPTFLDIQQYFSG